MRSITADKICRVQHLYTALLELRRSMAPFAPFLSEHFYRELAALRRQPPKPESVHLCDYPEAGRELTSSRT